MVVNVEKIRGLSQIADELKRCVEAAGEHRNGLIKLTSFDSAETLGAIDDIDVQTPLSQLLLCRDRARELLRARKRIAAS